MKKEFKTLINEATDAKVLFTWGRFNPPTSGHEVLIKKLSSEAATRGADFKIFPTKSEDPKKNPLSFKDKIKFMKKAFPSFKSNISSDSKVRTIIDALKSLSSDGYKEVTVVVGSDRVREFKALADKYNNKLYSFDNVDVISAGERDFDATGVSGMSASKLRALALDGNEKEFASGLPSAMPKRSRSDLFKAVRKGMQVEELIGEIDKQLLEEGIAKKAAIGYLAYNAYKGIKNLRDKKNKRLNRELELDLEKKPTIDYGSIGGSKFLKLLRNGLVRTKEISVTQRAFLNMKGSGSSPPLRDRIFDVTQTAFDIILNDPLIYVKFLNILYKRELFGESHLDGLIKKSVKTEVGLDLILEVYLRGILDWDDSERRDPNQYAFDRVNSFLSGGKARQLDEDLTDGTGVPFKEPKNRAGDEGTDKLANNYLRSTPGQPNKKEDIKELKVKKSLNIDKEFSELD